jgi:histidyl-tRNA synthetase
LRLAEELRGGGFVVVCPLQDTVSKKFKYCDKIGARGVFVIGEDERQHNKVKMRALSDAFEGVPSGTEILLQRDGVLEFVVERSKQ